MSFKLGEVSSFKLKIATKIDAKRSIFQSFWQGRVRAENVVAFHIGCLSARSLAGFLPPSFCT